MSWTLLIRSSNLRLSSFFSSSLTRMNKVFYSYIFVKVRTWIALFITHVLINDHTFLTHKEIFVILLTSYCPFMNSFFPWSTWWNSNLLSKSFNTYGFISVRLFTMRKLSSPIQIETVILLWLLWLFVCWIYRMFLLESVFPLCVYVCKNS